MTPEQEDALARASARVKAQQAAIEAAQARLAAQIPKPAAAPTRNWADIPGEALKNAPASVAGVAKGIYEAVLHPLDTIDTLGDAAAGGVRNVARAVLPKGAADWVDSFDDPETTRRISDTAGQVGGHYAERYGSVEGFKKALATDPAGTIADIAGLGMSVPGFARSVTGAGRRAALKPSPAPTTDTLFDVGDAGYTKARELNVVYKADAVADVARTVGASLQKDGFSAKLAPKVFGTLSELSAPPAGAVNTLSDVETVRRTLGLIARDFNNPTEQTAAIQAMEAIDNFMVASRPEHVVSGPAKQASDVLLEARGNWAAARRAEKLDKMDYAAGLDANAANSGRNLGNITRKKLAALLKSDKQRSGYSAEELAAMERAVNGTMGDKAARALGNLLGGGGGLRALAIMGAGSIPGALMGDLGGMALGATALPTVGAALKGISNTATPRRLEEINEMVRRRSPLYGQQQQALPSTPFDKRAALAMLLAAQSAGRPETQE